MKTKSRMPVVEIDMSKHDQILADVVLVLLLILLYVVIAVAVTVGLFVA